MRILFVENREKTLFWEQVALDLKRRGCEVKWLVQNPAFRPKQFAKPSDIFILPYPRADMRELSGDVEAWVRERHPSLVMDRGRNFFEAGAAHYDHYKTEIHRILAALHPDLVVGESTLFHELLTIESCRVSGIEYVQPVSNRYPSGRFSLLAFDTQIPAIESGDVWPEFEAKGLAERIATAGEVPFYMKVPGRAERLLRRAVWAMTRGRVWWARLHGERYNTPSLSRKLTLRRQVKHHLRRWQSLQRLPADPQNCLLYPMQLQPEMNIDVWGRPYSDQVEIIREMLATVPPEFQVVVKANPKAKYELSEALFALATSNPRVCLLPLDMTMPEALAHSIGAVTATGTVGLEAICGKGRAISLRHPIVEQEFLDFHAASPAEAVHRLINEPLAGVGNVNVGTKLINRLVSQSFSGFVGDPASYPKCLEPNNINAVASAIFRLISARTAQQ